MLGPGVDLSGIKQVNFALRVSEYQEVPWIARRIPIAQDDELRRVREEWREIVFDVERVSLEDFKNDLQRVQFAFSSAVYCLRNGGIHLYLVFLRGVRGNSKVDIAKLFVGVAPTIKVSTDQNGTLWVEADPPDMDVVPEGRIRIHHDRRMYHYPKQ